MKNEWLLDVLSDLKNFAGANGMHDLYRQLDLTREVAKSEISSGTILACVPVSGDGNRFGPDTRSRRSGDLAT